jgi:hypothetical protein
LRLACTADFGRKVKKCIVVVRSKRVEVLAQASHHRSDLMATMVRDVQNFSGDSSRQAYRVAVHDYSTYAEPETPHSTGNVVPDPREGHEGVPPVRHTPFILRQN